MKGTGWITICASIYLLSFVGAVWFMLKEEIRKCRMGGTKYIDVTVGKMIYFIVTIVLSPIANFVFYGPKVFNFLKWKTLKDRTLFKIELEEKPEMF